jgi:hypothetical protein
VKKPFDLGRGTLPTVKKGVILTLSACEHSANVGAMRELADDWQKQ